MICNGVTAKTSLGTINEWLQSWDGPLQLSHSKAFIFPYLLVLDASYFQRRQHEFGKVGILQPRAILEIDSTKSYQPPPQAVAGGVTTSALKGEWDGICHHSLPSFLFWSCFLPHYSVKKRRGLKIIDFYFFSSLCNNQILDSDSFFVISIFFVVLPFLLSTRCYRLL